MSYGDLQTFTLGLDPYDPDRKIRDMDAAGIDVSVLTVNIPGPELLTPELGVQGARICNDYLAELCARYPGRFVGLATLPLQDVPAAMAEYDRTIHRLRLRGIFLFSHIAGNLWTRRSSSRSMPRRNAIGFPWSFTRRCRLGKTRSDASSAI